jgi:Transposase domain (DUF772)
VYAFLADHNQLFPPELFADVARQGVLQALEGLSDREAVSALRCDIAWKVAYGLRLDDEGFHPSSPGTSDLARIASAPYRWRLRV